MDTSPPSDPATLFERRALRERAARREAERLLEDKSRELFALNEALRQSDARIRAILDNLTDAVVTHGTDRRIETFSASAQTMFGYTVDAARSITVDTLVAEPDCNEDARHFLADWRATNLDAIVGHPTELVCRRQDGTRFDCEVSIGLLEAEQKSFIVSFRDIRRRKENEKKQQEMETMLRQSQRMEAIGTLAAGIAHEINTPLQYVGDNIGFLADAFGDIATAMDKLAASDIGRAPPMQEALATMDWSFLQAELPHALNEARDGTQAVSRIVKLVKEFSYPESKEKTTAVLREVIANALTVSRNQWKYAAEVRTEFDETLPPIDCYPGELAQVLINLVVNAAQAIEAHGGGRLGTIQVSAHREADNAVVRVTDNGPGIPAENLDKIFDLFFTTKAPGKGTGQGLAISKSIVETKHGGRLDVESTLGAGTTFTFRLPLPASL